MSRLIDVDALIEQIEDDYKGYITNENYSQFKFYHIISIEDIEKAPTIEPKKGKWEVCGDYEYICEINDTVFVPSFQCTECCEEFPRPYNYCPSCGTRMEVEE